MKIAIGIDTGGTCTDAAAFDYTTGKVLAKGKTLTTREDLSVGISRALDCLPEEYIQQAVLVSLSTTLATNACVEDKGARSKLVIFGLTDELMERLKVDKNYGIKPGFVRCIDTHSSADGLRIDQPDWESIMEELSPWIEDADSMACAELFGPGIGAPCEKEFSKRIEDLGKLCVCACGLTDRVDVIQRGATALLNARLLPIVQNFIDIALGDLKRRGCSAPVMVVRSDGSFMSTDATVSKPIETILTGPAASILAGKALTKENNYMVIDMGGTTTDVSMVIDGRVRSTDAGITIGNWRTSVGGVFVDTFALGGDTSLRMEKESLKLLTRRSMPLCTAADRWPSVKTQLQEVLQNAAPSTFPFYEMLLLVGKPSENGRYTNSELRLIDILKEGPLSLWHLKNLYDVDLYYLDTERLEAEGIILRCGLTPTDFMHIKGDYLQYDREVSLMAAECALREAGVLCSRHIPELNNPKITAEKINRMADRAYYLVEKRMYSNLVRILLSAENPALAKQPAGAGLQAVIDMSWDDCCRAEAAKSAEAGTDYASAKSAKLMAPSFKTDMLLLGMGAPTHVFLPAVARALGTECLLPENAEIGNAIGAVMGELVVREKIEITQWDDCGMYYLVHTPEGSVRFEEPQAASDFAVAEAEKKARKEACLRGACGDLKAKIILQGNSHGTPAGENMTYGGFVTAEVRYAPGRD